MHDFYKFTYLNFLKINLMLYCILCAQKKRGVFMDKIGSVTVSVYKDTNSTSFKIEADDEKVEQISYIIEDTLKAY